MVDPQRRYLLSDPDVDIHDQAFVRALSTDQFTDLLAQSLTDSTDKPANLDDKPASLTEGDAVVFFTPPRSSPSSDTSGA